MSQELPKFLPTLAKADCIVQVIIDNADGLKKDDPKSIERVGDVVRAPQDSDTSNSN